MKLGIPTKRGYSANFDGGVVTWLGCRIQASRSPHLTDVFLKGWSYDVVVSAVAVEGSRRKFARAGLQPKESSREVMKTDEVRHRPWNPVERELVVASLCSREGAKPRCIFFDSVSVPSPPRVRKRIVDSVVCLSSDV